VSARSVESTIEPTNWNIPPKKKSQPDLVVCLLLIFYFKMGMAETPTNGVEFMDDFQYVINVKDNC